MKYLIAIPCMDMIPVKFAQSLLYLRKPGGTDVTFKQNSLVYDSRNLLSLYAIQNGYDYVLWIDSDMTFPADAFLRLIDTADRYASHMVTGLYFKRDFPTLPVVYDLLEEPALENGSPVRRIHEFVDYKHDSVSQVRGCGFGFCLTSVPLLKNVWDSFGPTFTPLPWAGEDISFCHRVNQLGYKIFLDSSVSCGHIGSFVFDENIFIPQKVGDNLETKNN